MCLRRLGIRGESVNLTRKESDRLLEFLMGQTRGTLGQENGLSVPNVLGFGPWSKSYRIGTRYGNRFPPKSYRMYVVNCFRGQGLTVNQK